MGAATVVTPAIAPGEDDMRPGAVQTLVMVAALWAVAGIAAAAEAPKHELTLVGGLHLGGQFEDATTGAARAADDGPSIGLILGFDLGSDRTLEVVWVHQFVDVPAAADGGEDVDLVLDTIAVGGTFEWPRGRLSPFVSGTVGLAVLSPDAKGYDLEVLFVGSLGGGLKAALSKRAAIRLEGRGVAMLATGSAAGVCGPGGCVLAFSGSGLGQLELLAGISAAF
jgi:hypothetical protein